MIPTIQDLGLAAPRSYRGRGPRSTTKDFQPAIILVLSDVVLALVPGLPVACSAPELVLLLVLPPIIYASAMVMSWRELRFNLRSISLSALGCVLFATVAVPGSPLADGARMARGLRIVSMPILQQPEPAATPTLPEASTFSTDKQPIRNHRFGTVARAKKNPAKAMDFAN